MVNRTKAGYRPCVACGAEVEQMAWHTQSERCCDCTKPRPVYLRCQGCGLAFEPGKAEHMLLDRFCIHCWRRAAIETARSERDWRYKFPWAA